ncbi:U32 family peptidase [Geotalea sp. SG265]|uniref:peptidase U32 family protein n=1 Tax=Geotalea sp. SG265 TaxID=2922867 RepID=UPI001FAF921E|nr:U32 family peptidase [Geotalea sp. SG265]
MKKPELLAPAGNMEKLRIAVHYGADAVYLGGKSFGLRNLADNFTTAELAGAVAYAHEHGVKVYLTVNAYPDNDELVALTQYLQEMALIPFDAYIAADPGVIETIREVSPHRDIHLSTQANTTNWKSALFWQKQDIRRVNLAREMSLTEMEEVRQRTTLELEAFVHGAMCISYSGRCLLSSVMSGRNANKGECTQPCRWNYAIVEETRPGEYFPVFEDDNGTFIFNSKDLCLLQYLPQLVNAGIDSLKIEGRMKGIYYVASVLRVYRYALDTLFAHPERYGCEEIWLEELCKISHRGYTTGFFLGHPKDVDHQYHSSYIRNHEFVAIVQDVLPDGTIVLEVRNRITVGDTLEFIGPALSSGFHKIGEIITEEGQSVPAANPNQRIVLRVPFNAERYDLVRRAKFLATQ